jgi:hypothetical protein
MTRATRDKRVAELEARIEAQADTVRSYAERLDAAQRRVKLLEDERAWLAAAPVSDPLPEPDEAGA